MLPSNVTILFSIWVWRFWFGISDFKLLGCPFWLILCLPSQTDLKVDGGLMSMTFLPTEKRTIISQSLIKVWVYNCSRQEKHWVFFNLMKIPGVREFRTWRSALRLSTHCRVPEDTVKDMQLAGPASFLSFQTSLLASCLFWEEMSKLLRNCWILRITMDSVHLNSSTFWHSPIWEICILARKTI